MNSNRISTMSDTPIGAAPESWAVPGVNEPLVPCQLRGSAAKEPPDWTGLAGGQCWQRGPRDALYGRRVVLLASKDDCTLSEFWGAPGFVKSQPHYKYKNPEPYYFVQLCGYEPTPPLSLGPWWPRSLFVVLGEEILKITVARIGAAG